MAHKLLLADDSTTIQKIVRIIFSDDEYELTVTDNGDDALSRAREVIPDVMLIDAIMPGKDGYEVCRDAKQDPLLADIPILLLTGVFDPFDETKAQEAGADDAIEKPFESQILLDKVAQLIELRAERLSRMPVDAVEILSDEAAVSAGITDLLEVVIEEVPALDDPWSMAGPECTSTPDGCRSGSADVLPGGISEQQLTDALAKVSREVVERIVREVVPDLAEAIIREEIRKIKEGI